MYTFYPKPASVIQNNNNNNNIISNETVNCVGLKLQPENIVFDVIPSENF